MKEDIDVQQGEVAVEACLDTTSVYLDDRSIGCNPGEEADKTIGNYSGSLEWVLTAVGSLEDTTDFHIAEAAVDTC